MAIPMEGMLTLNDIAKIANCSRKTVGRWMSVNQPFARRLKVLRLGYNTLRVRPADWLKFQEANLR